MGEATERFTIASPAALPKDLLPRVLSGAVMAAIALTCNWFGALPFAVLVLGIALAMSWEWSRMVRGVAMDTALVVHGIAVGATVVLAARGWLGWAFVAVAVGSIAVAVDARSRQPLLSALGVAYVGIPAIALIWLRGADAFGAFAILFVFVIVWTTDTFAYLCGRMIGGPKLWPALSPGKTWAGTIGGLAFAALAGALFTGLIAPPTAPLALAASAIALSIVSQIGDLAESALKRAFAVKNASSLIPGHGGFMDRMDGIVTAASLAALLAAIRGAASPGQALLLWS